MEYSDSEDVASDFHSAKYVREKFIYTQLNHFLKHHSTTNAYPTRTFRCMIQRHISTTAYRALTKALKAALGW